MVGLSTWSGMPDGDSCHPALLVGTTFVKYGRYAGHASGFSSEHPGGGNFTMGDGSVHFLSTDVEQKILIALSTRRGGEVVSIP